MKRLSQRIKQEKDAQYEYGPPSEVTRYCPDHHGVMVMPIGPSMYQCPLDGKVYEHKGSIADQTPDGVEWYVSPHPIFEVDTLKDNL